MVGGRGWGVGWGVGRELVRSSSQPMSGCSGTHLSFLATWEAEMVRIVVFG
jgi:hypothetical protein